MKVCDRMLVGLVGTRSQRAAKGYQILLFFDSVSQNDSTEAPPTVESLLLLRPNARVPFNPFSVFSFCAHIKSLERKMYYDPLLYRCCAFDAVWIKPYFIRSLLYASLIKEKMFTSIQFSFSAELRERGL